MKIKIISTPSGEAPLEVREQWIGCEMEASDPSPNSIQMGVLGGDVDRDNLDGYAVEFLHAVEVLEKKSRSAALWWHNLMFYPDHLIFGKGCCEVIE